jgi:hypothetical protein
MQHLRECQPKNAESKLGSIPQQMDVKLPCGAGEDVVGVAWDARYGAGGIAALGNRFWLAGIGL